VPLTTFSTVINYTWCLVNFRLLPPGDREKPLSVAYPKFDMNGQGPGDLI